MTNVHPTAILPSDVILGDGVEVGPYAVVEPGAVIGAGSRIGPHVTIGPGVVLGRRVQVFPGAALGLPPQIRPSVPELGGVQVGDDTVIREYVTVNAGSRRADGEIGSTRVGARCMIMAYAHVGHDCIVEDDVILVNGATLGGFVRVEHHATVSAMVPVHQHVRIGAYSYVGGGFRVVQDVPPYVLAAGEPLKPYGLNVVGLRRNGFTTEQLRRLRAIYHHFFRSGLNTAQALARIEDLEPSFERDHFAAFLRATRRGVIR